MLAPLVNLSDVGRGIWHGLCNTWRRRWRPALGLCSNPAGARIGPAGVARWQGILQPTDGAVAGRPGPIFWRQMMMASRGVGRLLLAVATFTIALTAVLTAAPPDDERG